MNSGDVRHSDLHFLNELFFDWRGFLNVQDPFSSIFEDGISWETQSKNVGFPDSANKFLYWYSCWILPKKFPSAGINSSIFIGRNTPPKSIPNGYLWKRDEIFEWNVSSSNYHFVSKRTCLIFPVAGDFFFWNMLSLVVVEEPLKVIVWLPWVIGAAKCPCGNFRRAEDVGSAGAPWTPSVPLWNESLISTTSPHVSNEKRRPLVGWVV